jgi:hypothetical protein
VIYIVWAVSGSEVKGLIDKTLDYVTPSVSNHFESLPAIAGGWFYGYLDS